MILDTTALDGLLSNDRPLVRLLKGRSPLHLPAIVLGEYRFGLMSSTRRERLEASLDGLEQTCVVLAIDSATARHYAVVRYELKQAGTPIPANDLWIAALVRQHGYPLVTRDAHFANVSGIKRIGW